MTQQETSITQKLLSRECLRSHSLLQGEVEKKNAIALALYELSRCMNNLNAVALTDAKALQNNAQAQSKLNEKQKNLTYKEITYNMWHTFARNTHQKIGFGGQTVYYYTYHATMKAIDYRAEHDIQIKNSNIDSNRDLLTNTLTLLRQQAQVKEAQVASTASASTQTEQISSGFLQLLQTLSQLVSKGR